MKFLISTLILVFGLSASAGQGPFLLGAIIGDPTGLSGRMDVATNTSIDGALSWSGGTRSGTQVHGDYLLTKPHVIAAGDAHLDVYYGIGARLISISSGDDKGKLSFGPRAPLGLRHEIRDPSLEFFGEVALILDIVPSTTADVDVGVGLRYRF